MEQEKKIDYLLSKWTVGDDALVFLGHICNETMRYHRYQRNDNGYHINTFAMVHDHLEKIDIDISSSTKMTLIINQFRIKDIITTLVLKIL